MPAKLTWEAVMTRAASIHGDRYEYHVDSFTNSRTKMDITCNVHGLFKQSPYVHNNGSGCQRCGAERTGTKNTKTAQYIMRAFYDIHGTRYHYRWDTYVNTHTPMIIVCDIHGEFKQSPNNHYTCGCPTCAVDDRGNKFRKTQCVFIANAVSVHGNTYRYDRVEYRGSHVKILIICRIHGIYSQKPYSHLAGHGCPTCSPHMFA